MSKTPRELLLEPARVVADELDERRRRLVRQVAARCPPEEAAAAGWFPLVWQQLVRPYRIGWALLAPVWLAILLLNLATPSTGSEPFPRQEALIPEELLRAQQLLRAELFDQPLKTAAAPATEPEKPPPPRSALPSQIQTT